MTGSTGYATVVPSRPLGVAILAVLVGIFGFFILLGGLLLLALGSVSSFASVGVSTSFFGTTGVVAGIIIFVIGLIVLGIAVGLWHLRMWALVLAILFTILEMVSYGLRGAFISLGFILALIIFVYLLAVSRHFA